MKGQSSMLFCTLSERVKHLKSVFYIPGVWEEKNKKKNITKVSGSLDPTKQVFIFVPCHCLLNVMCFPSSMTSWLTLFSLGWKICSWDVQRLRLFCFWSTWLQNLFRTVYFMIICEYTINIDSNNAPFTVYSTLIMSYIIKSSSHAHFQACQKPMNEAPNTQHLNYMFRLYFALLVKVTSKREHQTWKNIIHTPFIEPSRISMIRLWHYLGTL